MLFLSFSAEFYWWIDMHLPQHKSCQFIQRRRKIMFFQQAFCCKICCNFSLLRMNSGRAEKRASEDFIYSFKTLYWHDTRGNSRKYVFLSRYQVYIIPPPRVAIQNSSLFTNQIITNFVLNIISDPNFERKKFYF